jgi:hypothetical protein
MDIFTIFGPQSWNHNPKFYMKHSLLLGALLLGTLTTSAQSPTAVVTGTVNLGGQALGTNRAVTDTLSPGDWANDPNTQLVQWGALCAPAPGVPCGYLLGTSPAVGAPTATVSQRFDLLDYPTAIVEGLIFWFYAKDGNPNGVLKARLQSINGPGYNSTSPLPPAAPTPGIAPNTILASKDFTLAQVDTGTSTSLGFTTVMFDSPVWVNQQFAAGFNMTSLAATDSVGLLGTNEDIVGFPDYSWLQVGNTWLTYNAAFGANIDLCVFALLDNSSVGINEPGSMNNMRMSFMNGNISNGSVLLGYDVVENGRMDLIIHGNNGQIAYQHAFGSQGAGSYQHEFSTQGWAAGTYFVTLKNNGRPITKKLVVQ